MARWHHPRITLISASCRWSQISVNWLRLAAIGSCWQHDESARSVTREIFRQLPAPCHMLGDPHGPYYLLS